MKKFALLTLLLTIVAVAGKAQESRQDLSISGSAMIEPYKVGSTDVKVSAKRGLGALISYRYMLTPRGAIEANYAYTQNSVHFIAPNIPNGFTANARQQEITGAYVFNFNYKNFNPFLEAGGGALRWSPILNIGTTSLDFKTQTTIVALYGGGVAYELSPSFDIRVEYRGIISKVPDFGVATLSANRNYNIFNPTVGLAYHF